MRKKIVTSLAIGAVMSMSAMPAFAGGLGEPEIEPEVFTADDEVAAGTLGSNAGLIIVGLIVGGLVIAGDSN
ncbi:MAG: hypothetical protein HKN98_05870 [Silicimonas sp.]|nr:hypothetical protein [Silicimonas sp.]NNF92664.1 hypothetical protein [Boseongicola sp.]RZW06099.1 MAG: hypothetical protein EX266_08000 [Paracoccaceae bacterium]NND18091.1 hypothetical protein [Silicimonas sp.]NND22383.1 hypothetical protein [Silicimonas sp.]